MRISGKFSEVSNVKPITVIEMESNIEVGTPLNISGWGTVKWAESTLSDDLQYATVEKMDYNVCNEEHSNDLTDTYLNFFLNHYR